MSILIHILQIIMYPKYIVHAKDVPVVESLFLDLFSYVKSVNWYDIALILLFTMQRYVYVDEH